MIEAVVEEASRPLVIELVIEFTGEKLIVSEAHAVVFLATFPAKDEREQDFAAITRDVILPLQGEVALWFLQRGVHRITLTDKLVQAKCKGRPSCLWVR